MQCLVLYRLEVYCGRKESGGHAGSKDTKSGPGAVVRNLGEVFGSAGSKEKMLIVTDRFNTPPALVMQLLALDFIASVL
ncbi:hypothetical protein GQ600_7900 [Phytophthora cactorum]|nr:hypothetical protein GQ600_7900 [Phytophthora cactorum]